MQSLLIITSRFSQGDDEQRRTGLCPKHDKDLLQFITGAAVPGVSATRTLIRAEQPLLLRCTSSCGPQEPRPLSHKLENYVDDTVWDLIHKPLCKMNSRERKKKKKITNQQESSGPSGSRSAPHLLLPSESPAYVSRRGGRSSFARAQVL